MFFYYIDKTTTDIYTHIHTLSLHDALPNANLFDEIERRHPYSQWATRAQLMASSALYQAMEYDDAVIALDRFIQLHPGNEDIAYAYYLKALCYYERISDVERDQEMTELAMSALTEVNQRFPNTDYARDAALKLDLTHDQLAGKEMAIGRWYLQQGYYRSEEHTSE